MGAPAAVEVDAVFVILELLERRRKPVRLGKPPPPPPPPPPEEKAPPPALWGCGPGVCLVGYNLAAVETKEAEAVEGKITGLRSLAVQETFVCFLRKTLMRRLMSFFSFYWNKY